MRQNLTFCFCWQISTDWPVNNYKQLAQDYLNTSPSCNKVAIMQGCISGFTLKVGFYSPVLEWCDGYSWPWMWPRKMVWGPPQQWSRICLSTVGLFLRSSLNFLQLFWQHLSTWGWKKLLVQTWKKASFWGDLHHMTCGCDLQVKCTQIVVTQTIPILSPRLFFLSCSLVFLSRDSAI